MPIGGSAPTQTYTRSDGVRTGAAVNAQAKAALVNDTAALADFRENDLATAINSCWFRTGGNQPSADLPLDSHKFTGVGVATARTHYAAASQVQDSSLIYGGTAGGTGDAITLDLTPSITAYAAGQMFLFKASATNTTAATADVDTVGVVSIKKGLAGSTALAAGDITNGGMYVIMHDGTNFQLIGAGPFQPLDADLTAIGALAKTDGNIIVGDGSTWVAESGATARASLGLTIGTHVQAWDAQLDTWATVTPSANGQSLVSAADYAAMRGLLDLEVGTDVAAATVGQGTHTIVIPAGAMLSATTSGAASGQIETSSNKINVKVLDFDDAADEYAHFNIAMPKSWNESTITFRAFWTTTATDTDGVAWGLEAVAVSDNESADAAWGTAVVVTDDAQGATTEVLVTAVSGAVTIGGTPAEGDIVFFRVFRDVSDAQDDMTEDARLIAIQLFFTTNAATDA
jgi:hypothetical protein